MNNDGNLNNNVNNSNNGVRPDLSENVFLDFLLPSAREEWIQTKEALFRFWISMTQKESHPSVMNASLDSFILKRMDFIEKMNMDYDSLFTYRNLYLSYLKARRNKRDKDEVLSYGMDLERNLHSLEKRMKKREFLFGGYYEFQIHEPKERNIQAIYFEDRILQHCLCDFYLVPLLERHLIYDNAATRIDKGTDFARRRVKSFMNLFFLRNGRKDGYVLKYDIHHYFPSISHKVLKEKLSRIVLDEDILSYLFFLIDTYHEKEDEDKGLPIGNQISQCFGLLYLDRVDRIVKESFRMKYYSRYMDDGIIIHEDKRKLRMLLSSIREQLKKDGLTLNPKTRIDSLSEGFEYLGFHYSMDENGRILQVLKKKNKERIIRYVKKRMKEDGEYDVSFYEEYLRRGNNHRFLEKIKRIAEKK